MQALLQIHFGGFMLYVLQSNVHRELLTGTLDNTTKILTGSLDNRIVSVYFNEEGDLINMKVIDDKFEPSLRSSQNWLKNQAFVMSPIKIKEFFLQEYTVGIRQLTSEFEEYLQDKKHHSLEDQEMYNEMIEDWRYAGNFVFWWGRDYWCDKQGVIIAT
jgi:hypothetical protein